VVLIPTFRLPVQIHTRSANAKWLDEIAHINPLWINPLDAGRWGGIRTGELVGGGAEIGHLVLKAWVTEGSRPGGGGRSPHMGRWKPFGESGTGQRQLMATVDLDQAGTRWKMKRRQGSTPYESSDPDTSRIWWKDVGVHQNLTFGVHPDPISGMHCWHQAVRVRRTEPGEAAGDIGVHIEKSRAIYRRWLEMTRSAFRFSPDDTRRPYWLLRPLKPSHDAYKLPEEARR